MAIVYKCDRCGKEIDRINSSIHKINFRLSINPRPDDEELKNMLNQNLDGLEFCEECAKKIALAIIEPLNNSQEKLGI